MKSGVIYCAISPSGKKYYGFSSNFEKRKIKHQKDFKKIRQSYFYTAIRKYGFDSIQWIIVETVQSDNLPQLKILLSEREKYWIQKDKTYLKEFGYNMTLGGEGKLGYETSLETKSKMSFAKRNMTQETKDKIADYRKGKFSGMKGKEHSEKTRNQMKKSHQDDIPWNKGKSDCFSKETLDQLSNSLKGRTAWNKGLKFSN